CFPSGHVLDVGRVDQKHGQGVFEQIIDRLPIHASRNLVKKILEWEYAVEIERTRLLMRPAEQCPASSSDAVSSHEGACPQGAGVPHGQAVLSASPPSGGHRHV